MRTITALFLAMFCSPILAGTLFHKGQPAPGKMAVVDAGKGSVVDAVGAAAPEDWRLYIIRPKGSSSTEDDPDVQTQISWKTGNWLQVLNEVAGKTHNHIILDWPKKEILLRREGRTLAGIIDAPKGSPAQVAPIPLTPGQNPQPSRAAPPATVIVPGPAPQAPQVATPAALASYTPNKQNYGAPPGHQVIVPQAFTQPPAKTDNQACPQSGHITMPARREGAWTLEAGKTLYENLLAWASSAGYCLFWGSEVDYPVTVTTTFTGTFDGEKDVVAQVMDAYAHTAKPLKGQFYPNRVLEVIARGFQPTNKPAQ